MDVMTASPTTIIVKLYEGALRHAHSARRHLDEGHVAERVVALDKMLAIVNELQGTLDFEQGGEIATQLYDLYAFVTNRILEANATASTAATRPTALGADHWHDALITR